MNIRTLTTNAIIAALYLVVTAAVAPLAFMQVQLRLSELFNHLVVYNKRYFFGIVLGVFLANYFFSPTKADLVFGLAHTALSLAITIFLARFIKNKLLLMVINAFVFSFNMFIIAYMLKVFVGLDDAFIPLWAGLGLSEFITMLIAIPIIYLLNKQLNFERI